MYSGLDKGGGGLVGVPRSADALAIVSDLLDFSDTNENTSADEALVCLRETEDGELQKVIFCGRLDSESGDVVWSHVTEDHVVLGRTIGMSQMTSMLRDSDRNNVYENAIKACISHFIVCSNCGPVVLDIGTGTGLLSLFAVKHGAEKVIACEMFQEMAKVAESVVYENHLSDMIDITPHKSCDIVTDEPFADILISELLDSALLGEGILFSHADGISRLLKQQYRDATRTGPLALANRVVPHSGSVFATLVESNTVQNMGGVNTIPLGGATPYRDESAVDCRGGRRLLPIHWREVAARGDGRTLSNAVEVLNFEFFHEGPDFSGSSRTPIQVSTSGMVHGVMLWWQLYLLSPEIDPKRMHTYSTMPGAQNWQDHWLQVVFPLPVPIQCSTGDTILVTSAHNGINIWIEADMMTAPLPTPPPVVNLMEPQAEEDPKHKKLRGDSVETEVEDVVENLQCTCGWHMLLSSERLEELNDLKRASLWETALMLVWEKANAVAVKMSSELPIILDVSDGSTLAITLRASAKSEHLPLLNNRIVVVSREQKQFSHMLFSQVCFGNEYQDSLMIWDGDSWEEIAEYFSEDAVEDDGVNVDTAIAETKIVACISDGFCFQLHAQPTWQALRHLYVVRSMRQCMVTDVVMCPLSARVLVAAIELEDLYVSHGTIDSVSGFSHKAYDEAQKDWHIHHFPYKLGTFRHRLLTEPTCVAIIDYEQTVVSSPTNSKANCLSTGEGMQSSISLPVTSAGRFDGTAIWVDYFLLDGLDTKEPIIMSPLEEEEEGGQRQFKHYSKVFIKFNSQPELVVQGHHFIHADCEFIEGNSDFQFNFTKNDSY